MLAFSNQWLLLSILILCDWRINKGDLCVDDSLVFGDVQSNSHNHLKNDCNSGARAESG